LVNLFALG